ncbi:PPK2 family polyphosphate kinase [Paenibacillus sp. LX16]|uniref:PPK2 family polyphosphate kinase n=1 Tax=Paenibacillus sp. LX16 TaxID=1740264 RepID=UPI002E289EED|nr:PPK2 family polyphosphate kinase [Paenibacillus sp. LX16]
MSDSLGMLTPGKKVSLKEWDPKDTKNIKNKEEIRQETDQLKERFTELQSKLFTEKKQSVLFVFQGMDCSGKDGVIKQVFSNLNPAGVTVHSFKSPTAEELSHDFLWRAHSVTPGRGYIAAFNRSYYEDVLITRVHGQISDKQAKRNIKHIKHFEQLLLDNGVKVVKIFLHISKQFQLEKLIDRIEKPHKNWKLDPSDLQERKFWKQYIQYYEDVLELSATKQAPWYVVPSDNRWYRDYTVLRIAVQTLEEMKLSDPDPRPELESLLPELYKERDKK